MVRKKRMEEMEEEVKENPDKGVEKPVLDAELWKKVRQFYITQPSKKCKTGARSESTMKGFDIVGNRFFQWFEGKSLSDINQNLKGFVIDEVTQHTNGRAIATTYPIIPAYRIRDAFCMSLEIIAKRRIGILKLPVQI